MDCGGGVVLCGGGVAVCPPVVSPVEGVLGGVPAVPLSVEVLLFVGLLLLLL